MRHHAHVVLGKCTPRVDGHLGSGGKTPQTEALNEALLRRAGLAAGDVVDSARIGYLYAKSAALWTRDHAAAADSSEVVSGLDRLVPQFMDAASANDGELAWELVVNRPNLIELKHFLPVTTLTEVRYSPEVK